MWDLLKLSKVKRTISFCWVYKLKYKVDASIERYKAYLVTKGCTQKKGIEYHETFSPTIKFTTIQSIIAIAVENHWDIHQFNVNNTFLHVEYMKMYMRLPPGHPTSSQALFVSSTSIFIS